MPKISAITLMIVAGTFSFFLTLMPMEGRAACVDQIQSCAQNCALQGMSDPSGVAACAQRCATSSDQCNSKPAGKVTGGGSTVDMSHGPQVNCGSYGQQACSSDGGRVAAPQRPAASNNPPVGKNCVDITNQITATVRHPKGPGHCDGKITGQITNNSANKAQCYVYFWNGSKREQPLSVRLKPGQKETGNDGIWSCDSDRMTYSCYVDNGSYCGG